MNVKRRMEKTLRSLSFFVNIQNAEHTDYTKTTFILHKFEETFPELMSIPTSFTRPGT